MKTFLAILISFAIVPVFAQNSIDLANVYYRTSPFNQVRNSSEQKHLNLLGVDLKLPLVINKENVLIIGTDYQQTSIKSTDKAKEENLNLTSVSLQIGWEHQWNSRSKIVLMSMTRLNSDFKRISFNHFQQGGLVLGTTSRSDHFDWKYGMYYNTEFFGPMLVPLFGFNWKMNDQWRLKLIAPIQLELSYQAKNGIIGGLRFDGVNGSFRVHPTSSGKEQYIDKADNNVWGFAEKELGKNVWFHLKAGYSILRKYRTYSSDEQLKMKLGPVNLGDDRSAVIPSFKNGLSFEARLIYRLPLAAK